MSWLRRGFRREAMESSLVPLNLGQLLQESRGNPDLAWKYVDQLKREKRSREHQAKVVTRSGGAMTASRTRRIQMHGADLGAALYAQEAEAAQARQGQLEEIRKRIDDIDQTIRELARSASAR